MWLKKLKKSFACVLSLSMLCVPLTTIISSAGDNTDLTSLWSVLSDSPNVLRAYTGTDTDIILPTEINGTQMTEMSRTFYQNTSIISVIVPEGYITVQGYVFRGASSLISISLPNSLESISGTYGFRDCTSLTTVNIPEKITSIPNYAFQGCTNPDLVIDIQSTSITSVGSSTFKNVVGTIKVYSQEMYDLIYAKATTATVTLVSSTDPTNPPTPSLDYTSLNNALADGEAVDKSMYTEATVEALTEAILSGKAVKDNTSATQTDRH